MATDIVLGGPRMRKQRDKCEVSADGYWDGWPSASGWSPTIMLGQDLAEAAQPVRDGTAAELAARDRKTGNGHGKRLELDLLIASTMPVRRD